MADFHQNGVISTLHNFSHRSIEDIENELRIFAKDDPIELILPSLYSELEGPALTNIVECLSKVKYLNHITIGLDRANKKEFMNAKKFFTNARTRITKRYIIWPITYLDFFRNDYIHIN